MQNRIIELETRIAYQDHLMGELNEVVTRQQQQLDHLEKAMAQLRQQLKQNNGSELARPEEEALPPHY